MVLDASWYLPGSGRSGEDDEADGELLTHDDALTTSFVDGRKVTDVVETIHFREGQRVSKGMLLVQLRDREQRAQLAGEFARLRSLRGEKQQEIQDLESLERQRERRLSSARQRASAFF